MFQGHSVEKLHHDEGLTVLLPDFMDGTDVGMVEGRSRLRLSLEAGQGLWVGCYFVWQELQRNKSVQRYILRLVHYAHSTATELLDNAVVRDGLADELGGCSHWREC